jgi:hypothetical protein
MAKLNKPSRDRISATEFAFPKQRKEPLENASHVRNAVARFNQVKGVTEAERCTQRKTGPSCWEFLWRENDADGNRTRRTAVIGTVEQFPTRDLAQVAVNGLRMCINQDRNRQREQSIAVADLVDHYIGTELSDEADWHSHATRIVYSEFLKRWIRPHWGRLALGMSELLQ